MDFSFSNKEVNAGLFLTSYKPVINKKALFADYSADYVIPTEPNPYGEVALRFRVAKSNVDHVFLICNDQRYLMNKVETLELHEFYEYKLMLDNEPIRYYFEVVGGNVTVRYDLRGTVTHADPRYYFTIIPGFSTPGWAKGAVIYQIYVDRFCNGDSSNDVLTHEYNYIGDHSVRVEDWNKYPATMGVREFYGGDLQGVMDKLDYLEGLGVDAIYFNPLFVSPSNHKYDIQDYDYIDPHIGKIVSDEGRLLDEWEHENVNATRYIDRVTNLENLEASNQLFAKLVEECHKRNIKVILDGVFNHCGSFNKWLDRERIYENAKGYDKGAFVSKDSPYVNFFAFHSQDCWPYNGTYDGWWGHDTLPKLNYEGSRKLYDYILSVARKWVSPPYNVDGWRLDVAADLGHSSEFNHQFWRDFRRAVKEANPNAIIIAEHYGDPSSWLQGDQWDTVMNYDAFMEPVTWFLTGMEKHSDSRNDGLCGNARSFFDAMKHNMANIGAQPIAIALNELSNHDHSRFLTRTNKVVGRVNNLGAEAANRGVNYGIFKEAVVIQMTWPGAPGIYYGDEAGVCGFTDPDNRRTYPWGHEDMELIEFHKNAIALHKSHKALLRGSLKELVCDYNIISYGRFVDDDVIIVVINNNEDEKNVKIPVWQLGLTSKDDVEQIFMTTEREHSTSVIGYSVPAGILDIMVRPYSAVVFRKVVK